LGYSFKELNFYKFAFKINANVYFFWQITVFNNKCYLYVVSVKKLHLKKTNNFILFLIHYPTELKKDEIWDKNPILQPIEKSLNDFIMWIKKPPQFPEEALNYLVFL